MAILAALISVPPNASINIFTDSESYIKKFQELQSLGFQLSTRQILKINNNLHIWNIICEIIFSNHLTVNLHYVKAHSGNQWNDYIDKECKELHNNSNSSVLTCSTDR